MIFTEESVWKTNFKIRRGKSVRKSTTKFKTENLKGKSL
nr:MAG TPA: hypothetical protein [Caudoviricetes sp.]